MDENKNTKPWLEQVKPEYREHAAIKELNDVNHLVETHISSVGEVEKLRGELAGSVRIPGESAGAEELAAWRKAVGIPDKGEEYEIPIPEGSNDKIANWARGVFVKAGVPKAAAKIIAEEWNAMLNGELKAIETERENTLKSDMEKLKQAWGEKFDGNVAVIKKLQTRIAESNKGMGEWLAAHNAENDPVLLSFLLSVAPAFLDDESLGKEPGKKDGEYKDGNFKYPDM